MVFILQFFCVMLSFPAKSTIGYKNINLYLNVHDLLRLVCALLGMGSDDLVNGVIILVMVLCVCVGMLAYVICVFPAPTLPSRSRLKFPASCIVTLPAAVTFISAPGSWPASGPASPACAEFPPLFRAGFGPSPRAPRWRHPCHRFHHHHP